MNNNSASEDGDLAEEPQARPMMVSGKDEMNLAEFPFATLRARGDSRTSITYEGWITGGDGTRYRQKWTALGVAEFGLPTEFDERVYIALLAITAKRGFDDRKVPFSVYQILKIMGEDTNKAHYEIVERSLDRLKGVTIKAAGSFWDNERKELVSTTMAFNLIDEYWLRYKEGDERVREEEGTPGYIVWSKRLWKSFQANYIKNLDLQFFYSLESPISRRLYRLLDKRMWDRIDYEFDVFDLAGKLGMARYRFPAKVLEKLRPAFDELVERGFLASVHVIKINGYTRVRFLKQAKPALGERGGSDEQPPVGADLPAEVEPESGALDKSEVEPKSGGLDKSEAAPELVHALMDMGLSETIAGRLVRRHKPEHIVEKLAYLHFLQSRRSKKITNPSGWLRRAIEENYGPPEGYSPAGEADGEAPESKVAVLSQTFERRIPPLSWQEGVAQARQLPPELLRLTAQLQNQLRPQMTEATFQAWIATLVITQVTDKAVCLAVPSRAASAWISNRLNRQFEETLTRLVGYPVSLEVEVVKMDMEGSEE